MCVPLSPKSFPCSHRMSGWMVPGQSRGVGSTGPSDRTWVQLCAGWMGVRCGAAGERGQRARVSCDQERRQAGGGRGTIERRVAMGEDGRGARGVELAWEGSRVGDVTATAEAGRGSRRRGLGADSGPPNSALRRITDRLRAPSACITVGLHAPGTPSANASGTRFPCACGPAR